MTESHVVVPSVQTTVLAHYERAVDLIAANFPLAPIVPVYYPDGLDAAAHYGGAVHADHPLPDTIRTVACGSPDHSRCYVACDANALLWLVHRGAIDFASWTPSPSDPNGVGYARVILSPRGGATQEHLALAMLAVRTALSQRGVHAIPVLDGFAGAALFIPFNDAPSYDHVRAWLHEVANDAVSTTPTSSPPTRANSTRIASTSTSARTPSAASARSRTR